MKIVNAIIAGLSLWILGVTIYTAGLSLGLSGFQAESILAFATIPITWLISELYYRKSHTLAGHWFGLFLFGVAIVLDAIITVQVFILPEGGTYAEFFGAPMFWFIGMLIICTPIVYRRLQNKKSISA